MAKHTFHLTTARDKQFGITKYMLEFFRISQDGTLILRPQDSKSFYDRSMANSYACSHCAVLDYESRQKLRTAA